ncbi:lipocalin family protein [Halarcobacter anaerophilus]|uniref:lipocalin family protein n=1 Tax=Halarcobacter anaerophilus TaxID=877500 RepID=UPI0005CA0F26|nr:lipocalin family protein [Halarcobacter anaerophilus]
MKYLLSTLFILLFITGCATKDPKIQSVKKLDLNQYLGKWYEIARYEHFFEKNCKNVNATYSLKKNNNIKVVNRCQDITTNEKKEAIGEAKKVDNTNSKLKVTFFWPFYGDYWVIMLAKDYSYAVVSEPTKKYLWILSRTKTLSINIQNKIVKKLKTLNFDTSKLIWTIQE